MGWRVGHGWQSFSHVKDFSFLLAFSLTCLTVHLVGTTAQGLPGSDREASPSMHLGEFSSNGLTHLDKEVAYIS